MKYVLAFKGVTADYKSAFVSKPQFQDEAVRAKLVKTYPVGKKVRSPKRFPMWLVNTYNGIDRDLNTPCDEHIKRVLLVKVPSHLLTLAVANFNATPTWIKDEPRTIDVLFEQTKPWRSLATSELEVLQEVNLKKYKSVHTAMRAMEKAYGLPRASWELAQANDNAKVGLT